jgi:hypothetical protein
MRKQFQEKPRKCFKAQKNTQKNTKFRKIFQRFIGARTIQIKYLELMKNILEPLINRNNSKENKNKFLKIPKNSQKDLDCT